MEAPKPTNKLASISAKIYLFLLLSALLSSFSSLLSQQELLAVSSRTWQADDQEEALQQALPQQHQDNNNDDDNDRLLVLHIGPSKTGTSSLQCSLQTTPFLAKSSYRYVGRTESQCSPGRYPVQNAVVGNNGFNQLHAIAFNLVFVNSTKARDGIKKRLSMIRQKNHSAILSAEEFAAMPTRNKSFWGTLHDAISPYKGKTRVVVTYRHLHEIMVSSYSEQIIGRSMDRHWMDKDIISFPEYWADRKGNKKHGIADMTSDLIASYEKHNFTNITVFNFHGDSAGPRKNGDDLIVRFICDLPNAEEACKAYKNDSIVNGMDPAARSRPSHKAYAQYDRIAKAAHSKGMLCNYNLTALDRKSAASAIQDRVERQLGLKYIDLPQTCLDEKETEEALRLSIQDGRGVWKDAFNEDALRSAFQHYTKEKKSFCAVDVDKVLSTDAWSQFIMHEMNEDAKMPGTKKIC